VGVIAGGRPASQWPLRGGKRAGLVASRATPSSQAAAGSEREDLKVMDEELSAQLERLRIAERENAELKRSIAELEQDLGIDFDVVGQGPFLPEFADEEEEEAVAPFEPEPVAETASFAAPGVTEQVEAEEMAEEQEEEMEGAFVPEPAALEEVEAAPAAAAAAAAAIVEEEVEAAAVSYTRREVMGMKVAELKAALGGADLPTQGLKKDLQQRLLASGLVADAIEVEAEEGSPEGAAAMGGSSTTSVDAAVAGSDVLKGMTVKQLKEALASAGAPVSGKKADLIERLAKLNVVN